MGLLGMRRKPWKDADPKKRLAGVMEVPRSEQGTLFHLATQDSESAIRQAAARRLKSVSYLEQLLKGSDQDVIKIARERLAGVAVTEIKQRSFADAQTLLDQVQEQSALTEIVLQANDAQTRSAAFDRLCKNDEPSPSLLARIAIQVEDEAQATAALDLVKKLKELKDVAKKAKLESIKAKAAQAIEDIKSEQKKPSAEKQRRERRKLIDALIKRAQPLTATTHPEEAKEKLATIREEWADVQATFSELAIEDEAQQLIDQLIRTCEKADKQIADVIEAEANKEAQEQALIACCEKWEERRQELGNHVDEATLTNLSDAAFAEWESLAGHEGALSRRFAAIFKAGAFEAKTEITSSDEAPVVELNDADRLKVEAILEEAQSLIEAEEWRDADYRYKELHKDWSRLTVDLPFEHPLRKGFHDAYVAFKEKCFQRREERRQLQGENLKVLEQLLVEAEQLAEVTPDHDALRGHFDALQDLQNRWKQVKPVPFKESKPLRKNFRKLCDKAYEPLRAHREEQEWRSFANITLAEEITERARSLVDAEPTEETLEAIKSLQQEWKDMGRLPRERQEELWETFKGVADKVYELLAPLFEERDKEREGNFEKKEVLLEELIGIADQDADSKRGPEGKEERQQRVERVKAIQAEWKVVGPVPREKDSEQWKRYKKVLDSFFGRRRKEFEHIAEEQTENLHQKLAIIADAADLAGEAQEWKAGTKTDIDAPALLREVKSLQSSWKQVGHIPKEKLDETWSKFKGYCDTVYESLSDWFKEMDAERAENLTKKLAILDKIEAFTKEDNPQSHREEVKTLQAEWRDIGYIPREKLDEVMSKYQDLCNIIFNVQEAAPTAAPQTSEVEEAPATSDEPVQNEEAQATAVPDESPQAHEDAPAEESTSAGEPDSASEETTAPNENP